LIQLRTGHAGLNHHLHHIGASDSPNCDVPETVEHFLLTCQKFITQQKMLRNTTRIRNLQLHSLLSSQSNHILAILKYAKATNRFLSAPQQANEPPQSHLGQADGLEDAALG
ncbi:hypothetical protein BT96DRAFT_844841, partial [Gymnopus androsaceus JB14]